eukprot:344278_1
MAQDGGQTELSPYGATNDNTNLVEENADEPISIARSKKRVNLESILKSIEENSKQIKAALEALQKEEKQEKEEKAEPQPQQEEKVSKDDVVSKTADGRINAW